MRLGFPRGFTLIEILVVIGIIGILSAIILGTLGLARTQGGDASVKANLDTIRTQSGLYYSNNSNRYSTVAVSGATNNCGTTFPAGSMLADTTIRAALVSAYKANGSVALYCNLNAAGTSYAIAAPLTTSGIYWCVDSAGSAQSYASLVAALTNGTDYTCN